MALLGPGDDTFEPGEGSDQVAGEAGTDGVRLGSSAGSIPASANGTRPLFRPQHEPDRGWTPTRSTGHLPVVRRVRGRHHRHRRDERGLRSVRLQPSPGRQRGDRQRDPPRIGDRPNGAVDVAGPPPGGAGWGVVLGGGGGCIPGAPGGGGGRGRWGTDARTVALLGGLAARSHAVGCGWSSAPTDAGRAHNASILAAYLEHRNLAEAESAPERFFMNVARHARCTRTRRRGTAAGSRTVRSAGRLLGDHPARDGGVLTPPRLPTPYPLGRVERCLPTRDGPDARLRGDRAAAAMPLRLVSRGARRTAC